MMKKIRSTYKFPVLIIVIFLFITYWRVPGIFFLQDEWQIFALVIQSGISLVLRGLGDERIFHFIPVNNFLDFLTFNFFGLHHQLYNIIGLLFHLVNSLLLFRLAKRIFRNIFLAIISAILFVTSTVPNQLVMWPVVSLNTLSLSFALLTWFCLLDLGAGKNLRFGFKVAILMLLSLLTLEYSAGLLFFIPIASFIYIGKKKLRNLALFLLPVIIVAIFYISLRVYPVISSETTISEHKRNIQIVRELIIKFPVRYIGQVFIPQPLIKDLALTLSAKINLPREALFTSITFLAGILILVISGVILLIKKKGSKTGRLKQTVFLSLAFILCSSLPFLFIPGLAGNFSLYPPRYLYFGLVGAVFLITAFIALMLETKNTQIKALVFLVIILYVSYNLWENWKISQDLYKAGQIREGILNSIKKKHPILSQKIIFFTESDSSFYGLPPSERILPYQSGFGQTLLIWYHPSENFPKDFFQNKFLWDIKEEGYKQVGLRGFGYFRDFKKMAEAVAENNIPLGSVVAYEFISKEGTLSDISEETRGRLRGYFSEKKKLDPASISLNASHNLEDVRLALDGKRNTFWDSKLTYNNPQYFELDFGQSKTIAEIQLDSYNNKNQNQVGYRVISSNDRINWEQLLHLKVIPPDSEGLVNLYFKPTKARYLRIEQIGNHEFATWVIHELSVYEAR